MNKKILSLVLVLSLVLGSLSLSFAATPTASVSDEAEAIDRLLDLGIVTGHADGSFRPDDSITREQFAIMAVRALRLEEEAKETRDTIFSDVTKWDSESGYIDVAEKEGIISGIGGGKFGLRGKLTSNDAVTLIVRMLGYGDEAVKRGGYPTGYVIVAAEKNLLAGIGVEGGYDAPTRRGFIANVLNNALDIEKLDGTKLIDKFEEEIEDEDLKAATEAVEKAEASKLQEDVDAAQALVSELEDSEEKTALQERIDAIEVEVVGELRVESVSAINNTTLEVTVSGDLTATQITAEDFTVKIGNTNATISSVVAGTTLGKYIVRLDNILANGDKVTVTGADDLTGSASVNYATSTISSVEGIATTFDSTKAEQRLGIKINGALTSIEALDAEGYDVQFQANEAVFAAGATVSNTGILDKTQLTNLVNPTGTNKNKFKYKVVVTKDGAVIAESAQTEVKVFDGENTATSIKSFKLKAVSTEEEITSNKLVLGEKVNITDVIAGELVDNRKDVDISELVKIETSNPFVVAVDTQPSAGNKGVIEAKGTGTATITIKSGNSSKTFTVTAVSEARKVTSVVASESSLKLARSGSKNVTLTLKDQYGDVMFGATEGTAFNVSPSIVNSNGDTIGTLTTGVTGSTDNKGKITLGFTADAVNTGNGTIRISKPNGATIISIPLSVESDIIAKTYKLETANTDSANKVIDINDEEIAKENGDHEIKFKLNQYTAAGSLIGPVANANLNLDKDTNTTAGNFAVEVTDPKGNVSTVSGGTAGQNLDTVDVSIETNGEIKVAPKTGKVYNNKGTYTIKIYDENKTLVSSTTFTVKDTAPVVSSVNFVKGYEINSTSSSAISALLPEKNITITGAGGDGKVRINDDGVVYIDAVDKDGNGTAGTYEPNRDIYLGKLVVAKKSGNITGSLNITGGSISINSGSDGVIVVGLQKRGESTPAFTQEFTVKN